MSSLTDTLSQQVKSQAASLGVSHSIDYIVENVQMTLFIIYYSQAAHEDEK